MIAITCSACQKKLAVKDDAAGKKVRCPACGAVMTAPAPVRSGSGTTPDATIDLPPTHAEPSNAPTHPPSGKPDVTIDVAPASGHDPSLIDFLAPPQADDELGRLGGYRILKILGHGGMGVVFLGEDVTLRRKVAIKAMLPHLAGSKSSQERFTREARLAASIEHDHIVPIFQVGTDRSAPFIVMPFLKGEPLDARLKQTERLPLAEVLRIGREIARALDAAHQHGLIHRDIKPANIWLETPEDRVKILDFGLARGAEDAGLTQQGAIVGTPAYMAPEQARGETVDARCDLFSLGVVLYRLSTGKQPFVGKDSVSTLMEVATREPAPPSKVNHDLPPELSDLVMRLLEKDPAKRIATAADVVKAIRTIEQEQQAAGNRQQAAAITTSPALRPVSTQTQELSSLKTQPGIAKPRRRRLALVGIACAALAAFCLLLIAGGIVYRFTFGTGEGTLLVEVDKDADVRFKNGKLEIRDPQSGKLLYTLAPSELNKKLPAGKYKIDVVGADGLKLNTEEFTLTRNGEISVRVTARPGALVDGGGKKVDVPASDRFVLAFDSRSKVDVPSMTVDLSGPLTLEAFVTQSVPAAQAMYPVVVKNVLNLMSGRTAGAKVFSEKSYHELKGPPVVINRRTHVAVVYKDQKASLYVDGKLAQSRAFDSVRLDPSRKGSLEIGYKSFVGTLEEIRISKAARYEQDFTPQQRFVPDKDTIALYHCDEDSGAKLIDSSGNKHHGTIVGAKWVKAEETPIVSSEWSLYFGTGTKVNLAQQTISDASTAATLEGWFRIDESPEPTTHVIFGPEGLGFNRFNRLFTIGLTPTVVIRAKSQTDYGRWVHAAIVSDGSIRRLFVNGKLEFSSAAEQPKSLVLRGFLSISHMAVREIRISRVARYEKDFTPQKRFDPDKDTIALYHCDENSGDKLTDSSGNEHHGTIVGAKWVKAGDGRPAWPMESADVVLEFDGKSSRVDVPSLKFDEAAPFTVEAWAALDRPATEDTPELLLGNPEYGGFAISTEKRRWAFELRTTEQNSYACAAEAKALPRGEFIHLAGVYDKAEVRFYVNGQLQNRAPTKGVVKLSPMPFTLGANPEANNQFREYFLGRIAGVRLSNVARYDKDFTPTRRFDADKDTLALYHCDEGAGHKLTDSSGKEHHGTIVGAKWVRADGTPSPGGLRFNGTDDFVRVLDFKFDGNPPLTLEGWITPENLSQGGIQVIQLGDFSGPRFTLKYNLSDFHCNLARSTADWQIAAAMIPKDAPPRAHVAVIWDGKTIRTFLNGKAAPPIKVKPSLLDLQPKGRLYIGFGSSRGIVDQVRISKSVRYDANFIPPAHFDSDADTLALYRFDEGQGDKLTDSSGNGHHGTIVGAKWVKMDGPPLTQPAKRSQFALKFEGILSKNRVDVPLLRPDLTRPITFEGYFTPQGSESTALLSSLDGFVLSGKKSWGLDVFLKGKGGLYTKGILPGAFPVQDGKRTHLAGVLANGEIRLYVNGLLAGQVTDVPAHNLRTYPLQIGSDFTGLINEIRISKTARYDKDFMPANRFEPDADTIALYHFDEGADDKLIDSSGNGHHGAIVGAKWVKADQPPGRNDPTFFNGQDLKGFKAIGNWRVENGEIIARQADPPGYNALEPERGVSDFEITFEARAKMLKPGGAEASFRFRRARTGTQVGVFGISCADVVGGLLQFDKQGKFHWVKNWPPAHKFNPEDFNTYKIRVVGQRITTTINGKVVIDEEFADLPRGDGIQWTFGNLCAELRLRNLRLTDLSPTGKEK